MASLGFHFILANFSWLGSFTLLDEDHSDCVRGQYLYKSERNDTQDQNKGQRRNMEVNSDD